MIDVVIPAHLPNETNLHLLRRAIVSLESQTLKDFNVICVLNGCFIDCEDIIPAIDTTLKIQWEVLEGKASAAIARNYGVGKATSEYVAQLDADDQYHPKKLEKQLQFMEENNEYSFVGTLAWDWHHHEDVRESCFTPGQYQHHTDIAEVIHRENVICCGSVMFKREAFLALGGYREENKPGAFWPGYGKPMWEDWDLWRRAIISGYKLYNIPDRLYYWSANTSVER